MTTMWTIQLVELIVEGRGGQIPSNRVDDLVAWILERETPASQLIAEEFERREITRDSGVQLSLVALEELLFSSPSNPWATLALETPSDPDQATQRYRRLVRIFHPDRGLGSPDWCDERTNRLNLAYRRIKQGGEEAAVPPIPVKPERPRRKVRSKGHERYEGGWGEGLRGLLGESATFQKRFFSGLIALAAVGLLVIYLTDTPDPVSPELADAGSSADAPPAGEPSMDSVPGEATSRGLIERPVDPQQESSASGRPVETYPEDERPSPPSTVVADHGMANLDLGLESTPTLADTDSATLLATAVQAPGLDSERSRLAPENPDQASDDQPPGNRPLNRPTPPPQRRPTISETPARRVPRGGDGSEPSPQPPADPDPPARTESPTRLGRVVDALPERALDPAPGVVDTTPESDTGSQPARPVSARPSGSRVAAVPLPVAEETKDICQGGQATLDRFVERYQAGDLGSFLDLYEQDAMENDTQGRRGISQIYASFFSDTRNRRIELDVVSRTPIGQSICLVGGRFHVRYLDQSGRPQEQQGPIKFYLASEEPGREVRISRLQY